MPKISIEALHKRFGTVAALKGIDLAIEEGEFLGLLGPSGCGKTTTLNIVAGFELPTSGRVMMNGQDLVSVPANRRGMGVVFQSYALFPHLTVAENVAFGLEMRRVPRAARDEQVRHALAMVKLGAMADRLPRQLSGGQQQRVAVARALAIEPTLLLLDEPLSNLDAKLREEMQVELRAIQKRTGVTAVMVTHDQAEALAICDRIAVMDAGRIVQLADPLTLYDAPRTEFVAGFVGRSSRLKGVVVAKTASGAILRLAGCDRPVEMAAPAGADVGTVIVVALRPEKIRFVAAPDGLLTGTVTSRIFQGNAWLIFVDTPAGLVEVCELHRGAPPAVEGDRVALAWNGTDAAVMVSGASHG